MKDEYLLFTAGQFAKLHGLNKRTLHYYDNIGLFSPAHKGDNGYRYYTWRQSAELENILALRELGMSIEQIRNYLKHPEMDGFMKIAVQKEKEIDEQIRRLKELKMILKEKREHLEYCRTISDGQIMVKHRLKELLLLSPVQMREFNLTDMEVVQKHLQMVWKYSAYKIGCGSYIALDKVKRGEFEVYDGLFTPVAGMERGNRFFILPEGEYLCGYCIGEWNKLPGLYRKMLRLAQEKGLELMGNCYEMGLNEFAISDAKEYVTEVIIGIR